MRDISYSANIHCVQAWVADCLSENCLGPFIDGGAEILWIAAIHESNRNAYLGKRIVEQIISATIQAGRSHDFIACPGNVENSQCFSRLARSCRQCANASFESRYTAFKSILCRIHDTRIDVSKLPEPEEVRCVFWTIKDIRRRLIDGNCASVGRAVSRFLAGMQG